MKPPAKKRAKKPPQKATQAPSRSQYVPENNSILAEIEIRIIQRILGSLDLHLEEGMEQKSNDDYFLHELMPKLAVLELRRKDKKNLN